MSAIGYVTSYDPQIWPRDEEVDLSEEDCPNCGHQAFSRRCWDCGGEGGHDGYEQDPIWYDQGDMIPCDTCRGHGYHHWSRRCGWDLLLPPKWNQPEHRGLAVIKWRPEVQEKP